MIIYLLLLATVVTAQEEVAPKLSGPIIKHNEVTAFRGYIVFIQSPGYPEPLRPGSRITWNITAKDGYSKIFLSCSDLRTQTEDCNIGYFLINNGEKQDKICGAKFDYSVLTVNTQLYIEVNLPMSYGTIKCEAITTLSTERSNRPLVDDQTPDSGAQIMSPGNHEEDYNFVRDVELKLNGPAYDNIFFSSIPKNANMKWNFITEPGLKITILCDHIYLGNNHGEGYISVYDAAQKDTHYISNQVELYAQSKANKLGVEIRTITKENGIANCLVQALNGTKKYQYQNVQSQEVDSSEYGRARGVKATDCDCGWSKKKMSRIINGNSVQNGQYPWTVAILHNGGQQCGGTIITSAHVLTAAHCVLKDMVEKMAILTGTVDLYVPTEYSQKIQVKQAIIHHDYVMNEISTNHDISVLYLEEKIKFSAFVGPACISPEDINLKNDYVTVMGWGLTGSMQKFESSDFMLRAHVRIVDFPTCGYARNRRFDASVKDKICTWASGRTQCHGDSGGPIVWLDPETNRYTVVGVVSYGDALCYNLNPGVSTKVSYFYDWIQNVISDTDSSVMTCKKID